MPRDGREQRKGVEVITRVRTKHRRKRRVEREIDVMEKEIGKRESTKSKNWRAVSTPKK